MNQKDKLLERITDRTARVGVIGLGYVGLPLALLFEGSQTRGERVASREGAKGNVEGATHAGPHTGGREIGHEGNQRLQGTPGGGRRRLADSETRA